MSFVVLILSIILFILIVYFYKLVKLYMLILDHFVCSCKVPKQVVPLKTCIMFSINISYVNVPLLIRFFNAHGLPYFMPIQPWTTMVDHVLIKKIWHHNFSCMTIVVHGKMTIIFAWDCICKFLYLIVKHYKNKTLYNRVFFSTNFINLLKISLN